MIKPSSGKILLKDKDISSLKGNALADYRGHEIGYLFQEFELLDNMTAQENIALPLSLQGINNSIVKCFRRFFLPVSSKFMKQPSVLYKKNTGTIARRVRVVGNHHNGFVFFLIHGGKHIHKDFGIFTPLLSLKEQDVMRYLAAVESVAVSKLFKLIPLVYMVSLFFVFFLVYFACKYQTEKVSYR